MSPLLTVATAFSGGASTGILKYISSPQFCPLPSRGRAFQIICEVCDWLSSASRATSPILITIFFNPLILTNQMAEREGFEPSRRLPAHVISSHADSAALASLRSSDMAEREGFEPPGQLPAQRFSRPPHSTALASLRYFLESLILVKNSFSIWLHSLSRTPPSIVISLSIYFNS